MQTLKPEALARCLLEAFVDDVKRQILYPPKEASRDREYLLKRYDHEGLSFLTKTLPSFGKWLEAGLRDGRVLPFNSMKKKNGTVLPCCLHRLTTLVFDDEGTTRDTACPHAVRLLRQLAYMFYKLEGEYPQELVDGCIRNFVDVDKSLISIDRITSVEQMAIIHHVQEIIYTVFKDFDHREIIPRPGPGQNANRVPMWERYEPLTDYVSLEAAYPSAEYFYFNIKHIIDSAQYDCRTRKTAEFGYSRLRTVPKDSRGPRIICMEPPEYMWLQQGLARAMMDHIEHHPLTKGQVNFGDQTINGFMALWASIMGLFATLDMKEASDRISKALVELSFDLVPDLRDALMALCTDYITLPDGSNLLKRKFAPMGSALCFPVMSIVHFALAVASVHLNTGEEYRNIAHNVYVYGDDIVVPSPWATMLYNDFSLFELQFNKHKSFSTGLFRESCGIDAFKGVNVTPLKLKKLQLYAKDARSLQTILDYHKSAFERGLWSIANVLRKHIESSIPGRLPCVTEHSKVLGYVVPPSLITEANKFLPWKTNEDLQSLECRVRISSSPRPRVSMIGGWEQLIRSQNHVKESESTPIVERNLDTYVSWSKVPQSGF